MSAAPRVYRSFEEFEREALIFATEVLMPAASNIFEAG